MPKVEVIRAWPRCFESVQVELPEGATVADAVHAAALKDMSGIAGYAIHGIVCQVDALVRDGDRVELLGPLLVDPKEARRHRARPSHR